MKKLFAAAGVATLVASFPSVGAAQSAAATPEHTLTGNLSLVSEYRYRGIAQTDFKPAVQGGFDYAHKSGFYLGTWASNVSWLSDSGNAKNSLEWDFYGGFKGSVGDFGYDVGVLYYWFPGNYDVWQSAGNPKPNTTEVYIGGSWKMLTAKYSYAISDIFGLPDSKGSSYFDLTGNFDIGQGFTLVAHYGYQNFETSLAGDWSYSDWKIGIGKEFVGLNWGLNYIDTNADSTLYSNYRGKNLGKSTVQLTVSKTF